MEIWSEKRVEVRYQETDQMGIVYYANYLVWFELGRTDKMKKMEFPYLDIERELGIMLPVKRAEVNYHQSARYGDDVLIRTAVSRVKGPRIDFVYQVLRAADGICLATGLTEHAWVDRKHRPVRMERRFPELYQTLLVHLLP